MDWIRRLNQLHVRVPLGQGALAEVLHWAYHPALPDNALHRHTYFEVCRVGAYGAGVFIVQGRAYPIGPGDIFVARPGILHQIRNTATPLMELYWVSYQISPSERGLPRLLREFAESPLVISPDADGQVAAIWDAVRKVTQAGADEPAPHLVTALLWAIAGTFTTHSPDPAPATGEAVAAGVAAGTAGTTAGVAGVDDVNGGGGTGGANRVTQAAGQPNTPADNTVRLAVRFIHDNLDQPLRARDVAQHVNLSTRHLARLFQQGIGVSFHTYLTRARLDQAMHLLRRTELPVKDVGARVGYPDVHHFTRVFTQQVGCPPALFRRRQVEGRTPRLQTPGAYV